MHGNCQFKNLLNKVKDKVNSKINGPGGQKDSTQLVSAAGDSSVTTPASGGAAGSGGAAANGGATANGAAGGSAAAGDPGVPKPPVFPTTGKMVKVTTAVFGVDTSRDMGAPIQPSAYMFAVILSGYEYIMTSDHIRAQIGKSDTANGQGGVAGSLANAFAPGITTIINIKEKRSYTVANFLNILPAAILDTLGSFQDAFGLMAYLKKYMHQPDMKIQSLGHSVFHGYNANVVRIDVPVTPVTDENGRPSDALLYLHGMLSGNTNDLMNKHYDPSYKLFVETYYSHDLDGMIPAPITADKNILQVDGFYVGSVLKDEKGNKVVYMLQHIDKDRSVDEGMFLIPDGYEKMTHDQFRRRLREKLRGGR
jgi:hypothetical protein